MRLGQIGLLVAALAFAVYATRLRSTLADRLVFITLAAAGCILIMLPDLSNDIAHRVGIGRGADLVIYLFVVFSIFQHASAAARARQAERTITTLVREVAIKEAVPDSRLGKSSKVL